MKKVLTTLLLASTVTLPVLSFAKVENPFGVRYRWIVVAPDDSSTEITNIGGTASVDTQIAPEVDFTIYFTDHIAMELVTAVPRHRARANGTSVGNINLGEVTLLPPTITLQWHFLPNCAINPYLGAGVNYTYFFGVNPGPVATDIDYSSSFGGALQAGVDIKFPSSQIYLNLDVKKVFIDTDVRVQLAAPPVLETHLDINPYIFGIGLGYRFG